MKLMVLLVVSVLALSTADSREVPLKPVHELLHSSEEEDLPSPLDRELHQNIHNGSTLLTDEPQVFNFTEVTEPFPPFPPFLPLSEEAEGPRKEKTRVIGCTDKYPNCQQYKMLGICSGSFQTWMSENCPMSCNTCVFAGVITYKYGVQYEEIWNDHGSGGDEDLSIWRASHLPSGYCSLGDVGRAGYNHGSVKSVSVSGTEVIHPISFSEVWNDGGSGARLDCTVYKMNPPNGYTCLGGVAMQSHTVKPDRNRYCCVKDAYVVPATTSQTYKDSGTGADEDMSLWTIVQGSDKSGIEGNNFIPVNGYNQPPGAYLINREKATEA